MVIILGKLVSMFFLLSNVLVEEKKDSPNKGYPSMMITNS
jgi:hypothetical protein